MDRAELIKKVVGEIDGVESGEDAFVENWLDTGNYSLNRNISGSFKKGYPFGRVVEVFGDPSTGKSLLIYNALANVQKMGGIAILDDTEDAYEKGFGERIGIKNSELIRLSSLTVEEHFEKCFLGWKSTDGKKRPSLVESILKADPKCYIVIALDSLSLLSTKHEQEVQFEKPDMAKAKQIRAGLRMCSNIMKDGNLLHLVSNHVIAKIGVLYGPKKTTPGGSGLPFQSSVRLELSLGKKLTDFAEEGEEESERVTGVESRVRVAKNKVAPPFRNTIIDIRFDTGLDRYSGLLQTLVDEKIIEDKGRGNFDYSGHSFKRGSFDEFLSAHQEILDK